MERERRNPAADMGMIVFDLAVEKLAEGSCLLQFARRDTVMAVVAGLGHHIFAAGRLLHLLESCCLLQS